MSRKDHSSLIALILIVIFGIGLVTVTCLSHGCAAFRQATTQPVDAQQQAVVALAAKLEGVEEIILSLGDSIQATDATVGDVKGKVEQNTTNFDVWAMRLLIILALGPAWAYLLPKGLWNLVGKVKDVVKERSPAP